MVKIYKIFIWKFFNPVINAMQFFSPTFLNTWQIGQHIFEIILISQIIFEAWHRGVRFHCGLDNKESKYRQKWYRIRSLFITIPKKVKLLKNRFTNRMSYSTSLIIVNFKKLNFNFLCGKIMVFLVVTKNIFLYRIWFW